MRCMTAASHASVALLKGRRKTGASRQVTRKNRPVIASGSGEKLARVFRYSLLCLLGLGLLVAAAAGVNTLRTVPLGEISIQGYSGSAQSNRGVSPEELMQIVSPYRSQLYWEINLHHMQKDLEAHPWVRQATLFRAWPNKITIGIDEQLPIARWNTNHLLASSGDLVKVDNATLFSSLPLFVVPRQNSGSPELILHMVELYNSFQKILDAQQQRIMEFGVSDARDIWLVASSGAKIELGKQNQLQRLQRLVGLIDRQLIRGWEKISVADLRYAQGVSVRWVDTSWEEDMDSLVPLAAASTSDATPSAGVNEIRNITVKWGLVYG